MALDFASTAVTRMWNWKFKEKTCAWQLERLRTRYLTFKAIPEIPASEWDEERNVMHGADDAWRALIRENPFADAYLKRREPQWEKLQLIFEADEEGDWGNGQEVHNISSGELDGYNSSADAIEFLGCRRPKEPGIVINLVSSDCDSR
ncbi:hypothetical protein Salat_0172800 [Sesamum alatum]|uniref:Uncharacterized protein n=1 Tax=Sesamum alatum TaxID=300844 RepID=A0AAE1YXE6_9LAMI|nr:hypothetical protein Salat_0172800 [Sesamum alatum]